MIYNFYLLKPRMISTDFYYKVYVTNNYLYFIKIGGQFYSRDAYFNQLSGGVGILFWYWFKKTEKKQACFEAEIDQKIECGEITEILQNKHNYKILIETIDEIVTNKSKNFHTSFNDYGTISFKLKDGKIIKFIIPDTNLRITVLRSLKQISQTITIKEVK